MIKTKPFHFDYSSVIKRKKKSESDDGNSSDDDMEEGFSISNSTDPSHARATRHWDVKVPPASKFMVNGYMVPSVEGALFSRLLRKDRRVSVEVHHIDNSDNDTKQKKKKKKNHADIELDPEQLQNHLRGKSVLSQQLNIGESLLEDWQQQSVLDENEKLQHGEYILIRVLRLSNKGGSKSQKTITNTTRTLEPLGTAKDDTTTNNINHDKEEEEDQKTEFHAANEPERRYIVDKATGLSWVECFSFDLDDVQLQAVKGKLVTLFLGRGSERELQPVLFQSVEEASTFAQIVRKLGRLEAQRTQQRVQRYYAAKNKQTTTPDTSTDTTSKTRTMLLATGTSSPQLQFQPCNNEEDAKIQLVVEIVSAIHLPKADITGSDPYVLVRLGAREVHQTKVIGKTRNPIWTVDTDAFFILSTTPEEFFASSSGLTFVVKDYNALGKDSIFGVVVVSQDELLEGKGERMEHQIEFGEYTAEDGSTRSGKLYLRFRQAEEHDFEFMQRLKEFKQGKHLQMFGAEAVLPDVIAKSGGAAVNFAKHLFSELPGVYSGETFVPPLVTAQGAFHKRTKRDKLDPHGPKLVRVKPYCDPKRPEETKWLSRDQIEAEAQKSSTNWIETGSGALGKFFVEVIGCDELPNMDAMPVIGDKIPAANVLTGWKTDAFVCLVYEDTIVNTDVINDTLAPRWMPWAQRAFAFNIFHPSSQLLVGVFDYDSAAQGACHDNIGRATVDITSFRSDTVYTLYYDLFTSDLSDKRTSQGQILLRLRLEIPDARKVVIASLEPPVPFYINVATKRDYETARYTCEGQYDEKRFDLNTLTAHVDELQEYQKLLPILRETAFTVLLWRGHFPVKSRILKRPTFTISEDQCFLDHFTKEATVRLPMYSLSAFVVGVVLSEHYTLLPSFILFGVSWVLFVMSGGLSDDPSPWKKPVSVFQLCKALAFGQLDTTRIEPFQNKDAVEKYEARKEEFQKRLEKEAERKAALDALDEADAELAAMNDASEVQMTTANSEGKGISLNPLEPYLFPLQQNLHKLCVNMRILRGFVTWQEPIAAFWICISCFVAGVLFMFVPWAFLTRWGIRLVVWTFLGPWMKLVDIFYVQRIISEKDSDEGEAALVRRKMQELRETAESRQIKREELTKLKTLKRYMYGKYVLQLPSWKQARYVDYPLMKSKAEPFVPDEETRQHLAMMKRKYGQHVSGCVIPRREIHSEKEKIPWYQSRRKFKDH